MLRPGCARAAPKPMRPAQTPGARPGISPDARAAPQSLPRPESRRALRLCLCPTHPAVSLDAISDFSIFQGNVNKVQKVVKLHPISTMSQLANFFTKALPPKIFNSFISK
ncbi:hypothetical protein A2U01_0001578 [Trifolium medium]|uniref:Uncharacterized protein n=1 Tax=Trifolium medium TaxID=97028 RepID=A0A392M2G7_9FABA|nr:hypothetical protein [Trifolium medium]